MRESFQEYKKTLEKTLDQFTYLYSGDVLSGVKENYIEERCSPLTSPSFIINCIEEIYKKSIINMVSKSKTLNISLESIGIESIGFVNNSDIGEYLLNNHINYNYVYLFIDYNPLMKTDISGVYPKYYHRDYRYDNIHFYGTPYISESEKDVNEYYLVDRPIQSLVYSLHNMKYEITPISDELEKWEHKMIYDFYDCDFNVIKLCVKDLSKIRDEKISKLFDE